MTRDAPFCGTCNDAALDAAQARIAELEAELAVLREHTGLPGIDGQVISAAFDMGPQEKENPKWAFIDYEANAMSFGRWAKCGPHPAPYVRLDLVMPLMSRAALKDQP